MKAIHFFRSRSILVLIMAVFLLGISSSTQAGTYSGGSGEPNDPYLIATAEDMNEIGAEPNDWDKHFLLTADINLADYTGTDFNIIGYYEYWQSPNNIPFTGVFDGNSHTISNFTYTTTDTDCIGIFGYVDDANALIKDLTLTDPNIEAAGNSDYVGAIVGYLRYGVLISCGVEGGSVLADRYTGGLVGWNDYGTISNCYAAGAVDGNYYIGGLVGYNYEEGTISNCYATGAVSGSGSTGGLVGYNDSSGTISNCYATGDVSGGGDIGGLVGYNDSSGTISNCYATGAVSGSNCTGGLVGYNYEEGTISNCYAVGDVSGDRRTGGLVGFSCHRGTISNCYATGAVSGGDWTGGLVGYNSGGIISYSFWDIETTGQSTSAGGEGKTTAEMKTMSTFLGWGCGSCVWTIDEANDYPRLAWEDKPGEPISTTLSDLLDGSGAPNDPYLIYTAGELNTIGLFLCELNKHFKLMADIDLGGFSGTEFNIIPIFTGVFDGNSHTISNFTYATTDTYYIGLFGYVNGANALIKDLTLTDPNIEVTDYSECVGAVIGYLRYGALIGCGIEGGSVSGDNYTGGLVGENYEGTISNCYAAGDVSGSGHDTGGLVGENWSGTISNCYATGAVSGGGATGGLVGANYDDGTISNCYAAGTVSGNNSTGGLVGSNDYGTISNCYAAGTVSGSGSTGGLVGWNWSGTISNCYATGDVSGSDRTGGLVGRSSYGTISSCYAVGDVSGNSRTGGLVGFSRHRGTISNCYAASAVDGNDYTGGLVGLNEDGTISNCYAEGAVSGDNWTGGLVGGNWADTISNCYAAGAVDGNDFTGGLVGYDDDGFFTSCFWDSDVNPDVNGIGNTADPNVTGKTTAEMQTETTFTDAGWDFVCETANGTEDIWVLEGTNYPKLSWELHPYCWYYRTQCHGDSDCTGDVKDSDFLRFKKSWYKCYPDPDYDPCADFDRDGCVKGSDFMILKNNWLQTVPADCPPGGEWPPF